MERTSFEQDSEILADAIDNEDLVLSETSSPPSSVDDWDSLVHFNMIMELRANMVLGLELQKSKVVLCWRYYYKYNRQSINPSFGRTSSLYVARFHLPNQIKTIERYEHDIKNNRFRIK